MTKYILHGGATRQPSIHNDNYFKEILKDTDSPKILMVYFASAKEKWDELFNDDQNHFLEFAGDKKLNFVLAKDDIEILKKQIKDADIIYMRGGHYTKNLQLVLEKINNLSNLLQDKIIAGSSAGAYVLCKYYFSQNHGLNEGLGILPFKIIAHYSDKEKENLAKLKKTGDDLEIYKIPETEYIVINQ